jgi:hypothetical protein
MKTLLLLLLICKPVLAQDVVITNFTYRPWTDEEQSQMVSNNVCMVPEQSLTMYDTNGTPIWWWCCWTTDGQVCMEFTALTNATYRIQWKPSTLEAPYFTNGTYNLHPWSTIGTAFITNAPTNVTFKSGIVISPAFFRIKVEP